MRNKKEMRMELMQTLGRIDGNPVMDIKQSPIYYSTGHAESLLPDRKLIELFDQGNAVYQNSLKVLCQQHKSRSAIQVLYDTDEYMIQYVSNSYGIINIVDSVNHIIFNINNKLIDFKVIGDEEFVNDQTNKICSNFTEVGSYIKWWYSDDDYIRTILDITMLPIDSMYPFLKGETLEQYYQRFLDSTANIILLIGLAGTGKTTFIRGLLHYAKSSAIVTYDPALLNKDSVFVDFIQDSECSFLVLEDSDSFLSSRTDGNTMMHRFLNVSSGLVASAGKKLIFSTNLPSIRDVDSALIRPGRCFDVVKFDVLNQQDANILANDLGIGLDQIQTSYTIADIFHQNSKQQVASQSFGFNID